MGLADGAIMPIIMMTHIVKTSARSSAPHAWRLGIAMSTWSIWSMAQD